MVHSCDEENPEDVYKMNFPEQFIVLYRRKGNNRGKRRSHKLSCLLRSLTCVQVKGEPTGTELSISTYIAFLTPIPTRKMDLKWPLSWRFFYWKVIFPPIIIIVIGIQLVEIYNSISSHG